LSVVPRSDDEEETIDASEETATENEPNE